MHQKVKWSFREAIQHDFEDNFTAYQTNLDKFSSTIPLAQFSNLTAEEMLPHVSESINQSAMKSFGLKIRV